MPSYISELCQVCDKQFVDGDDIVVCPECGTPHHRECYAKNGACVNESLHSEGYVWTRSVNDVQSADDTAPVVICGVCGAKNSWNDMSCTSCKTPLEYSKLVWTRSVNDVQSADDTAPVVICGVCGAKNSWNDMSCTSCKTPLEYSKLHRVFKLDNTTGIYSPRATKKNTDIGNGSVSFNLTGDTLVGEADITTTEIEYFVGQNSRDFLMKFNDIKQKKSMSFNLYAFIFGFAYFFYRKMYKLGAVMLLVSVLVYTPIIFIVKDTVAYMDSALIPITTENILANLEQVMNTETTRTTIFFVSFIAKHIFCGVFFNRLYLLHTVKSIRKIRQRCRNSERSFIMSIRELYISELRFSGGISVFSFFLSYTCMSFVLDMFMSIIIKLFK